MNETDTTRLLIEEGFIRRAAMINADFMLKGSYITRQYFPDPTMRIPADLDWVYLGEHLKEVDTARKVFNKWATAVTEFKMDDNVKLTSFSENPFWRMIDYAMDDDFPTINTDLEGEAHGKEEGFSLDISFNIDPEAPPIWIMYQPLEGEPFYLPKTTNPANQIAWKLHQSIVRLRLKDLFDLYFLLQNEVFNKDVLAQALQIYVNECGADKKDSSRIHYIINGQWHELLDVYKHKKGTDISLKDTWSHWRNRTNLHDRSNIFDYSNISHITDQPELIDTELDHFISNFVEICNLSGLSDLCKDLPLPQEKKRTKFWGLF